MSDKEGVQWKCYVKSWVKKLTYPEPVKEQLTNFFEKYCPPTLNWISSLVADDFQVRVTFTEKKTCEQIEIASSSCRAQKQA